MKTFGIAAVLLLAGAGAAEAGEWRYVGGSDNVIVGYDVGSHRRSGSSVTVWTIFVSKEPKLVPGTMKIYDYFLSRRRFDCDRSTVTETQVVYYSILDTASIFSEMVDGATTGVVPDTIGESILDAACDEQTSTYGPNTAEGFAKVWRENWPSDRP